MADRADEEEEDEVDLTVQSNASDNSEDDEDLDVIAHYVDVFADQIVTHLLKNVFPEKHTDHEDEEGEGGTEIVFDEEKQKELALFTVQWYLSTAQIAVEALKENYFRVLEIAGANEDKITQLLFGQISLLDLAREVSLTDDKIKQLIDLVMQNFEAYTMSVQYEERLFHFAVTLSQKCSSENDDINDERVGQWIKRHPLVIDEIETKALRSTLEAAAVENRMSLQKWFATQIYYFMDFI